MSHRTWAGSSTMQVQTIKQLHLAGYEVARTCHSFTHTPFFSPNPESQITRTLSGQLERCHRARQANRLIDIPRFDPSSTHR